MKLGRNELCWCGSGKKYKKCHFLLEGRQNTPYGRIEDEMRKEFKKPICLCPEKYKDYCSKKKIFAHSVQRSKALGPIRNIKNEVLTFYQSSGYLPKLIGWKKASTFRGFCGFHDKTIFAEVEDNSVEPTLKQLFILGYRGICHELYQKSAGLRSRIATLKYLANGSLPLGLRENASYLLSSYEGLKKGEAEIENLKVNIFDPAFVEKRYKDFSSLYIEFSGMQMIAACGAISPDFDVVGNSLQFLYRIDLAAQYMAINILNDGGKIKFSLLWPKSFDKCEAFSRSLVSLSEPDLVKKVVAIIFGYLENVYFSESWWSQLKEEEKKEVIFLAKSVFYTIDTPNLSFAPNDWEISCLVENYF
ncbi:SEC-C domain-containing protein [Microbulbifer thermotolerans]|uniref:SEC-C domain-containing protein n=1 Tax=Microbulbifer thermotolerans TaxID=252514 RepID=UPI00224B5EB7|nr:SEC-C domain-containing protein [Microbulbifer thermotolerans]MCX2834477.1 SEC-C domain-containing protein [Microbulbifer thermotolerans]